MKIFETRNDFVGSLVNNMIMCEIGVFEGDFSKILFNTSPKELHLIDPFLGYFGSGDKDGLNMKYVDLETSYENLKKTYRDHDNVHIHKSYSQKVLMSFPDEYFDFIYIDADHDYMNVKNDLVLCKQKTKINGIIAGHDYSEMQFPGVVKAVKEFCETYNLSISFLTTDGCPSFGIVNI